MSGQAWTVDVDGTSHRIAVEEDLESGRASIRVDGKMATRAIGAGEQEREFPVGSMIYVLRRLPGGTFDLDVAIGSTAAISSTAGKSSVAERREERMRGKRPRALGLAAVMAVIVVASLWSAWSGTAYLRVPWKEWYSPSARVMVDFPGDPQGGDTQVDRGAGPLGEGSFHAKYRDHSYVLEHHDMGAPILERDAPRVLTDAVNAAWNGRPFDELSGTRVSNRDGVQFVLNTPAAGATPATIVRGVAAIHQRHLILAWVETPAGESQDADVQHFLQSVRLPFEYAYDAQGQLRMPDMPNFSGNAPVRRPVNFRLTALFVRLALAIVALIVGAISLRSAFRS
jgi:hypothetical protein